MARNNIQEECSSSNDCPEKMICVLHKCQYEKKICDSNGRCPEGYRNYWGTCIPELPRGCEGPSTGCPLYTACDEIDKNCYVVPCWKDKDCPSSKCLRTSSTGCGHCYM